MPETIGILDRVRELFQADGDGPSIIAKSGTAGAGSLGMEDPNNSKLLSDEGYRKNVVVYSCINIVARTASEPDLVVARRDADGVLTPVLGGKGKGDTPGRNLQELLDHPNREQSQFDWLERSLIEFGYSGNSITHKLRPKGGMRAPGGPVAELWQLTPFRTKLYLGKDNLPAEYEFPTDNPGDHDRIPAADIIHIKKHDPNNDHWGLSPMLVAARVGDLDNMGTEYLRTMFHNLGEPSALLIFKEIKNREQHQRAREMWKETHGGTEGWHQIGTLDSSVTWQEVGSRPNDMALDGVFSHSETRICGAFGVPPILVATATGLARSTYSNYKEAVRDFWTDTIVPMYTRYADKLTHGLAKEFGDDLVVYFDTSGVGALQEDRKELREFALKAWDSSLLPRRRVLALAQVEGVEEDARGDAYKVDEAAPPKPIGFEAFDLATAREALKLPPKVWRQVDRAADNAAPVLAAGFISAVTAAQNAVSLTALEAALKNNDIPTAENALLRAWEDQLADFRDDYREPLTDLYVQGGAVGDDQVKRVTVNLEAGPTEVLLIDPIEAAEFVEAQLANLVAEVSKGTKAAIRAAVMNLADGVSLRTVAKDLMNRIGLTARWIEFLEKKRVEGMSEKALAKLARKLIRRRAVNIALNEGRRAASEGQQFVWLKAKANGILKGGAKQFWITAGDSEVCHICQPMDGQERDIGMDFTTGTGDAVRLPPEPHPGCRCARGIKLKAPRTKTK